MNIETLLRIAALLLIGAQAVSGEVSLRQIMDRPAQFDGQVVTTTGLIGFNGGGAYIFPDFPSAAKGRDDAHGAAYAQCGQFFFEEKDNRCWFRVTGIVRGNRHGPSGDNPVEIEVQTAKKLRLENRVLWPEDFGMFLNGTKHVVLLESELKKGAAACDLSPGQSGPLQLVSGRTLVAYKQGSPESTDVKLMFRIPVRLPTRTPKDSSERIFKFVVREDGLSVNGSEKARNRSEN
jgi:hypothetical protein